MVLQQAHPFSGIALPAVPKLDRGRIAAGAGAIALNIAALLLLLVPAGMPALAPPTDPGITVVTIRDLVRPPPPPPIEPERVPVVEPTRPVVQAPRVPDRVQPVVDQVVVESGSLPAEELASPVDAGPPDIAPPAGPIAGMRLEYARAPSPPYPRDALRAGLQGTVLLQVMVDVDGRPLQVLVERSSGHRTLDDAARRFVLRHWTFRPATRDGRPVQAIGLVPVAYRLD